MNQLCSGPHNKDLRQYLKTTAEKTWQLVNWLTHDRDANQTASTIAVAACDTLIGHAAQLLQRAETEAKRAKALRGRAPSFFMIGFLGTKALSMTTQSEDQDNAYQVPRPAP